MLTGMGTAVGLLCALICLSVLGGLLPQLPGDPGAQSIWQKAVEARYGRITPLIRSLGLFNLFKTPLFVGLSLALAVDTALCAVRRASRKVGPSVANGRWWSHAGGEPGTTPGWEWLRAASAVIGHLAAAILLTALVARPALSWHEQDVLLTPGDEHPVGNRHELVIRTGMPNPVHRDGQLRDCRVPLSVIVDGTPVLTETIGIGHPLSFKGITFHLRSYGPAVQVITPRQKRFLPFIGGQSVEIKDVDITLRISRRPEEGVFFVEARDAGGRLIGSGDVADGRQILIQGVPVVLHNALYVKLQIAHDPTFGPAIGAAATLVIASAIVGLSHRRAKTRLEGEVER